MLRDDEKLRIFLEEAYRIEVRKQAEKATESKHKLWAFVNSSFGIWLLSAIFVTGAGAGLNYWQQKTTENLKKAETVAQLDFEIEYRLSQVIFRLYELTDRKDPRATLLPDKSEKDIRKALELLRESPPKSITSLYPDHALLGLPSLIIELKRNTDDPTLHRELDSRLAIITGKGLEEKNLGDVNQKAGEIISKLLLPRWKRGAFYFTDCSEKAPFC